MMGAYIQAERASATPGHRSRFLGHAASFPHRPPIAILTFVGRSRRKNHRLTASLMGKGPKACISP